MYYIGFDIGGTKCAVSLGKWENQKIEMPKTFNTELTSTIIIISTALLGIGLLIYEKKKNK